MMPRRGSLARSAALLCAAALAGTARAAEPLRGPASVVEGDRLAIRGRVVRLAGIDAPEPDQTCLDGKGRRYPCGRIAETRLAERVVGRTVACESVPGDRDAPPVALCRIEGKDRAGADPKGEDPEDGDLGGWLVDAGLAVADRTRASAYLAREDAARRAGRGLWRGAFTMPWDLRRGVRGPPDGYHAALGTPLAPAAAGASEPAPAQAPPAVSPGPPACPIKGNITRDGSRLYWVPGSRRYRETVITPGSGERWFCSEDEARAAGWQAPEAPFDPAPSPDRPR